MKAKLLFAAIISFYNSMLAQDYNKQIKGNWIAVFKEMKDTSTYMPKSCHPFPDRYVFNNDKLCINTLYDQCFDYLIEKDFIKTSKYSGYRIEKLNFDSLTIVQYMDGNQADDKLERIFLVRQETVFESQRKLHSEKNITATSLFFPTMKQNLGLPLNIFFRKEKKYTNLNLVGSIIIYPLEKRIVTNIKYASKNDIERIDYIKKIINNTFDNWGLTYFQNYESITLPFILECKQEDIGEGYTYRGIRINFLSQNINDFECVNGLPPKVLRKSGDLFSKGVAAVDRGSLEKAISFFYESYILDKSNIDNLYNIATVYTLQNDYKNACMTWKELDKLGQIQGKELFKEKCNR